MTKRWVCLVALLLICAGANAAPPHFAHRCSPRRMVHVRDKRFGVMAAVQTAAMVADVETTERGLHQNQFAEGNPLFGGRPGRTKLYSILGSVEIGELWAEHHLKAHADADPAEGRRKWWSIAGAKRRIPRDGGGSQFDFALEFSAARDEKQSVG